MAALAKLQARVRIQKEIIKQKNEEIQNLKAALRAFISGETDNDSDDSDIDMSDDIPPQQADISRPENEETETASDSSSVIILPEPIWIHGIHFEGIYICTDCAAEVVDGFCCSCDLEHEWQDEFHQKRATTDTQAINIDRSLVPRGNTPLLELDDGFSPPTEYAYSRTQEYIELLERGATRLMCETFHLEYTHQGGIFAWADSELYTEFAGPAMQNGDFWKIHLGRRIVLDDDDLDGSAFIEGLLEDALYFPGKGSMRNDEKWETVEETPGIWVTRLGGSGTDDEGDVSEDNNDEAREDTVNNSIRPDEYDTVDDSEEDDYETIDGSEEGDYEIDDPGYSWKANVPDALWESDEEKDNELIEESDDYTMSTTSRDDSDIDLEQ